MGVCALLFEGVSDPGVMLSLTHAGGPDSSRGHQRRELVCRSTQSGHTRTVIEERFPFPPLPLSFLFLGSVTHLGFILPPPSTRHPTRLHYRLLPQWVYLAFHSPVSFLRSLSFPFLPGSVNDLILMKHSLGGETKPHGWNLPPSISLNHPVLQNLAFIPNANRTDWEVWEF